jgi:hypothetical protein
MVLQYLIPTMILKRILPSPLLFSKFPGAYIYYDIVDSVKTGNLSVFDAALKANESKFVLWGTLMIVEKLRLLVVLTLFKKVWMMLENPSILPIDVLNTALNFSTNQQGDSEQTCCSVVNLISLGYMKGYISHEKQVVVLSTTNPFPSIQ